MAEALQQQQQQEEEEEEQQQPTSEESSENDEGSEELKDVCQEIPSRPLLSTRSESTTQDTDNDSPNMILYRKVRAFEGFIIFVR